MSIPQVDKKISEPLAVEIDTEFEEELKKLRQIQVEQAERMSLSSNSPTCSTTSTQSREEKIEADEKSIFVQHIDYGATASEVQRHFEQCGPVKRVTIPTDKFSHRPKGHAFVEFETKDAVSKAMAMTGTELCRRKILVSQKRTNEPRMALRGAARGGMMRGGARGGARGGGYNTASVYKYVYVAQAGAGAGQAQRGTYRPRGRYAYAPY